MSLDENVRYDTSKEHPHIRDDGTIKEEGKRFVLEEFKRRLKNGELPSAMGFYNALREDAREIIDKEHDYRFLNMRTCSKCRVYFDGT